MEELILGGKSVSKDDLMDFLHTGANSCRCGIYLHHMEPIYRQLIYHDLEYERLMTKYNRVCEMYNLPMDWNQIFFVSFLEWMSDKNNRGNYMEVAMRLSYPLIARERGVSLQRLETLLIAVSGLLPTLPKDDFTRKIAKEADYLIHKYRLNPIPTKQWNLKGLVDAKSPILRLSQIARVLYDNPMPFNRLVSCRTRDDIIALFGVPASAEWCRYFGGVTRHIGVDKCDILGINFVIPSLFAYGHYSSNDDLVNVALALNEALPAESNYIINRWRQRGLTPTSSFETQSLIQLYKVYCIANKCQKCVLFRHMCSDANIFDKIPIFLEHMR